MKTKLILLSISAAVLMSCSSTQNAATTINQDYMDKTVTPGEDFTRYTYGQWLSRTSLGKNTKINTLSILRQSGRDSMKSIIEHIIEQSPKAHNEMLIKDFYTAYTEVDSATSQSKRTLIELLDEIKGIENHSSLAYHFGKSWSVDRLSPIWFGVWGDPQAPTTHLFNIGIDGLSLGHKSYYLSDMDEDISLRKDFKLHVNEIMSDHRLGNLRDNGQVVLDIETALASLHWDDERYDDASATYNVVQREKISEQYAGFNWAQFIRGTQMNAPRVNVNEPDAVRGLISLVDTIPISHWKIYLAYQTIKANASVVSEEMASKVFDFYGRRLSGKRTLDSRSDRAVMAMSKIDSLGFVLGQEYTDKHFKEGSKQDAVTLINDIKSAMYTRLKKSDWMSAKSRDEALRKLSLMQVKVGYPDAQLDYSQLTLTNNDALTNKMRLLNFSHEQFKKAELLPVNHSEWLMTPQDVNAYYDGSLNEVVFPAAILQPPLFDVHADDASNYGSAGAIMGHEIAHAFDREGSQYNADGVEVSWWTDQETAAYKAKEEKLIKYYSTYEPLPNVFLNGHRTASENMGDIVGLSLAYDAYKSSLKGKPSPIIDGLTGEQRLFVAWAQTWKEKRTEKSLRRSVKVSRHPYGRVRALAVRHVDGWYEAFKIKPSDPMFIAPEDRIRFW